MPREIGVQQNLLCPMRSGVKQNILRAQPENGSGQLQISGGENYTSTGHPEPEHKAPDPSTHVRDRENRHNGSQTLVEFG